MNRSHRPRLLIFQTRLSHVHQAFRAFFLVCNRVVTRSCKNEVLPCWLFQLSVIAVEARLDEELGGLIAIEALVGSHRPLVLT